MFYFKFEGNFRILEMRRPGRNLHVCKTGMLRNVHVAHASRAKTNV